MLYVLFSCVEFLTFVDVFAARFTAHVKRGHQTDGVLPVFGQFHARDLRWIEIRRIVFLKGKVGLEADANVKCCRLHTFKTFRSDIFALLDEY